MKTKVFLPLILAFIVLSASNLRAQVNLLYTFSSDNTAFATVYFEQYIGDFRGYAHENKIYNEDFSLRKQVNITPPFGYRISGLYCVSERIFNADNQLEYLIAFEKISTQGTDNERQRVYLVNESGDVIKDFGAASTFANNSFHLTSGGEYRLQVIKYTIVDNSTRVTTEIYSLPGRKSVSVTPKVKKATELAYKLRPGETATMKIYNAKGQLIETKQVDYVFERVLLNTTRYSRGVYVYEVNGFRKKFTVR